MPFVKMEGNLRLDEELTGCGWMRKDGCVWCGGHVVGCLPIRLDGELAGYVWVRWMAVSGVGAMWRLFTNKAG
jgi:hypothetical protein